MAILIIMISMVIYVAANNVYTRVVNDNMQVALTFDDGPHPGRTPEILDILKKHNVKATFFPIGQNVEYYPDIFDRIVTEGHEVGNHTYSHQSLLKCTEEEIAREISLFDNTVYCHNIEKVSILRPPGGLFDGNLKEYAIENELTIVLWSVDTLDWSHKSVDDIVKNVLENTHGGDIILMHDYISGKSPTPQVLEIIIPKLKERGFEFVTISELIKENTR